MRNFGQVTVHLPPDLVAALDAAAGAEGLDSRSELIRRYCADGLRRRETRQAGRPPRAE